MKKILFLFTLLMMFLLAGCGKYSEKDVIKDLEKKLEKSNSYKLSGILEITNNDDVYQYEVNVGYKKNNNYRVSLINKSNNHEQIILKNKEGVYIITPSLNKSFKFQSEWPNNNSQVYLLDSILHDIKSDNNREFKEEENKYIFTTKASYPNNTQLVKQRITFNKDLTIDTVEVLNSDGIVQILMKYKTFDFNSNFNDDFFDLNSIIEEIDFEDESNLKNGDSEQTTTIEDIIYPLYIPTGTALTEKEKISTTSGERIILTFDGEKPFLLVEETSSASDEFNVIPTFGEPFFLADTIGILTDNSITWSSNGIDYYIVSDVMSQIELIEIASSISAIPTIK